MFDSGRICNIFNLAALYRESIYKLIDQEWECDWYIGRNDTDIKGISEDALKSVHWVKNKRLKGNWYWQTGVGKLIRKDEYSTYLMTGEFYCLSTWWILLQHKLLYPHKRVYLWTHGWYGREGSLKKWIKKLFFSMSDKVLTYGDYAREVGIAQGFNPDKILPIHNSLNHSYQKTLRELLATSDIYINHFKNQNPTLIFIGRLTKVKKLEMLLEAMADLKRKGSDYNLILIGSGEDKDHLEELTHKLGLSHSVWFYGPCYDDHQNAQLIYDADLCVAPGNVGLTAMHSMVFGTPVLTHDDFPWQMPEFEAIVPGKTGCFFKRNSVESLSEEIERWCQKHKEDRDMVRRNCYQEIDTKWTPEYQLNVLKTVINSQSR
ncbi:MAG: glycosyltransferase [Clostridia bacterium]|nr:glycosyltransferase [Clostridia bacterium]